ncbi:hypothetical protein BGW36DRAFT_446955 [Talaromyces proteolyticus]|uniref:GPR1/FUN34/YaaH-class plasma membrane protein n=1 Tax=Talaromyces proteolyticus TaxID=1131652 RepID=A0AAD4KUV2_9EURO|nr:uncharacterized protein BGW36DRAFT_446955 [Talaromyces proteolyticus]KAH8700419.1 hypothetical protein BGW36DRAFT_446955 [Talaromyces proteolyticus]
MSVKNIDDMLAATTETLHRNPTAESILLPIPRDVFEKLYLNPKTPAAGNLRKTFGNPTPISLMGFLLSATPLGCIAMGWRGSGGNGGAILPVFIFFGGLVQLLGGIGEWILGNTFSSSIFFTYGTFWLVYGTSLMPFFATGLNYSPTGNILEGQHTPEFYATTGFFYVILAVLTFVYFICSIRTNICLFIALFLLSIAAALFSGVYFQLALGNAILASKLQTASGAFIFALCFPIWWIFIAQILETVDFPVSLPVGDLSTVVLGKRQREKKRQSQEV